MRDQRHRRRQHYKKPKQIKVTVVRCMKHMKPVMSNESCNNFIPKTTFDTTKQCMFCKYKS